MTIYRVRHVTEYSYRRDVGFGQHQILYRPRDSYDQRLLHEELLVTPEPARVHWLHDVFGNCVALVDFKAQAARLRFETLIRVDHIHHPKPEF